MNTRSPSPPAEEGLCGEPFEGEKNATERAMLFPALFRLALTWERGPQRSLFMHRHDVSAVSDRPASARLSGLGADVSCGGVFRLNVLA